MLFFFFSSRRRHTRLQGDWSSDVCSSDLHFQEPGIVRTKTGRIVTAIRNQGEDNAIWITWSDNDGKTWTPVKKSPMIGHPADLTQLADGRLLCTYGQRTERHNDPGGIRATFS